LTPSEITRSDFDGFARERVGRNSLLKPEVWTAIAPLGRIAVKDSSRVNILLRGLSRYLMNREHRALSRLIGMQGVPRLLGKLDCDAFACTWLPGKVFDRAGFLADTHGIAQQMRVMVEEMNGHGVFHLDLRQRQNLLLSDEHKLQIVDFGGAVVLGAWGQFFIGRFFAWIDRQAVCKWVARFAPQELSLSEAQTIVRARWWRRAWFLSPHKDRGELKNAQARIARG